MPDAVSQREPQQDSAEEFLLRTIHYYRSKLIDLSARNPLVNFRHSEKSRTHVRIVNEVPEILFGKLEADRELYFDALKEPVMEPADELDSEFQSALRQAKRQDEEYRKALAELGPTPSERQVRRVERRLRDTVRSHLNWPPFAATTDPKKRAAELGINPDYSLPKVATGGKRFNDSRIQTLHYRDDLERKLSGLRDSARVLLKDAGLNALYCVFGFVEYYDSESSEEKMTAPLLFYPVEIDRLLKDSEYFYYIRPASDKVETNIALCEKLRQQRNIELPQWVEQENGSPSLEAYFDSVERAISGQKDWKLQRFVTVGLFTFATLAMYKDLDPNRWPAGSALKHHPVLRTLIAGAEVQGQAANTDYEVDKRDADVLLIADADSSQHSAVLDCMQGKNCVIQGPPGTGKSQTITNLIAAALYEGKTVLFVAEKMAALEVVKKRLRAIEDFCFELHSTKTSKGTVAASLAARLEMRQARAPHSRVAENLQVLDRTRKDLLEYVQRINEPAGRTSMAVRDVLLGSAVRETAKDKLPKALGQARFQGALEINPYGFRAMKEAAVDLENKFARISAFGSAVEHPWHGFRNSEITAIDTEDLLLRLRSCCLALEELVACVNRFTEISGAQIGQSAADLAGFCELAKKVPPLQGMELEHVYAKLGAKSEREKVARLLSVVSLIRKHEDELESMGLGTKRKGDSASLASIQSELGGLGLLGSELTRGELPGVLAGWHERRAEIGKVREAANALAQLMGMPKDSVASVKACLTAPQLLSRLPEEYWAFRLSAILEEKSASVLKTAIEKQKKLQSQRGEIDRKLERTRLPSLADLQKYVYALKTTHPLLRLFSADCRAARRAHRFASKSDAHYSTAEISRDWQECIEFIAGERAFFDDKSLRNICGDHFAGIDTQIAGFVAVNDWARTVRATLDGSKAGEVMKEILLNGPDQALLRVRGLPDRTEYAKARAALEFSGEGSLAGIEEGADRRIQKLSDVIGGLHQFDARHDLRLDDLRPAVQILRNLEEQQSQLNDLIALGGVVGDAAMQSSTSVNATLSLAEAVAGSGLAGDTVAWLFQRLGHVSYIRQVEGELRGKLENFETKFRTFADAAQLDNQEWCGATKFQCAPLAKIGAKCTRALDHAPHLQDYIGFLMAEDAACDAGIGPVLTAYEGELYANLSEAVEFVYYRSAAEQLLAANPRLKQHSGAGHEQLRKQYRRLDEELIQLRKDVLAARLADRPVPEGNSFGRVAQLTDMGLVRLLAGQTKPRVAVRDLIARAGRAIQALKPCWMMSPMSVAQFLEPGAVVFDLVIMDEASQIRPQEALGAVVRGKQVVVVGDDQQLPPTPFFQKLSGGGSEPDDEGFADEEQDSILSAASARFPGRRPLKWHYRSEHGTLIAFSNREFYRNELIIFPSPQHQHEDFGVKLMAVEGVYGGGLNEVEAQAVVAEAARFMKQHPKRSLGIVAVNAKQAEFIREQMDRTFASEPSAEAFRAHWAEKEDGLEEFFVKNLENVQGDERDVIFISTVYGKDATGSFHQRFGPINSLYGHRRLNVLFTRAKKKVVVFSSMSPEWIQSDGKHPGVAALKSYLQYARDGRGILTATGSPEGCVNEFERWVTGVLSAHGFESVPQLVFAGYAIDIAVRDPRQPGVFLCGIECDGATYHSAKSARERDRLRQQILEKHGWNIYRIWSTDWFRNPQAQTRALLDYLKTLAK